MLFLKLPDLTGLDFLKITPFIIISKKNLKSNGFELHYYDSPKIGELDFVLQKGLHTELVEIKSEIVGARRCSMLEKVSTNSSKLD